MTNGTLAHRRRARLALLTALFIIAGASHSTAQPDIGGIGFGFMFADPVAFTIKGGMGPGNAWDAAIGTSSFGNIRIHAEYLWGIDAFNSNEVGLYIGIGGIIGFGRGKGIVVKGKGSEVDEEATSLGVRGAFGLNAFPFSAPLELFVEVAPILRLSPDTHFLTELAVGVRYYP